MICQRILKEKQKIQTEIEEIQKQIKILPQNKLICTRNGNRYKWYQSDGHISSYIPKANRELAEQLAIKKYLTCKIEELYCEKKILEKCIKGYSKIPRKAETLLMEPNGYSELLAAYFKPKSKNLQEWMTLPYEHNDKYLEQLIHKTSSGNVVRCKSEAMIDLYLYTHQIPFRYECALKLEGMTIYSDFTIRHPQTGEVYYWEHFGMMDDPTYSKNVGAKLQLYIRNGIIPSIRLITTYETREEPLSSEVIEKIVEHYFI